MVPDVSPEADALRRVVEQVTSLGIPYMVAGSLASSHHGRPHSTHDVELDVLELWRHVRKGP
jgi:hypothetical protein